MKSNQTFSVIFWINKSKINSEGKCPLWCRITVNGERSEISLKQNIIFEKWDSIKGRVRGKEPEIKNLNKYIKKVDANLNNVYTKMYNEGKIISAYNIKCEFLGVTEKKTGFMEIAKSCLSFVKNEIGKTYTWGTVKNYVTTIKHLEEFVKNKYGKNDIDIRQVKPNFILDFKQYSTTKEKSRMLTQNGYIKHFQRIKRIINYAIMNEWIDKNPFQKIKEKLIEKEKVYLTKDEIETIQSFKLSNQGLGISRDMFLFCCYTGLSFCDLMDLSRNNISLGMDGRKKIHIKRNKSHIDSLIPVLDKAEQILSHYINIPSEYNSERIFPSITNQCYNRNLKSIFKKCKINKVISSHKARHTFATTICANNGVPIDTTAKMMGHTDLKTTQIYYQTTFERMSSDIDELEEKLNKRKVGGNEKKNMV
ncbi:MAG: site-specific integrase [Bacteroidota bacterium]